MTDDERLGPSRRISVGEVALHCRDAGAGPLVVLLHGFPEFWYSWRYQIPALVEAEFRVVAPDMRGYNLSDKPKGVLNYRVERLIEDVRGLLDALGVAKAHVVGHDWGAVVAWFFAMHFPERLERLAILNVAHPVRYQQSLRTLRQLRKSWYVFAFQVPGLPEYGFRRRGYRAIREVFRRDPVRKGAFTEEDIDKYVEAMAQPGALTSAIHYYRAAMRDAIRGTQIRVKRIEHPVLVLWGEEDRYIGSELAEPDPKWVPLARVVRFPDASHWVQVDRPERVNEWLIPFLRDSAGPGDERTEETPKGRETPGSSSRAAVPPA